MKKIKIGFLPLYTKLYDDNHPGMRDSMVVYMKKLVSLIESQGFEVVLPPEDKCEDCVCRIKPECEAAAAKFNADEDIVAVVTYHLAYSPSEASVDAIQSLKVPVIVLDTTEHYELSTAASYDERTNWNHGIHGAQEMCSMLKRRGVKYTIVSGHALHSEVIYELTNKLKAAAAAWQFKHARVGLAGYHFEGMIDFIIADEVYKKQIGAQVVDLTPADFKKHYATVSDAEVKAEIDRNARDCDVRIKNEEVYYEVIKCGLAMRKWVDAEKLTALTINFNRVGENGMTKMCFPEACREMERGIGYAGEGDTLTAGLVGALTAVYPDTSFAEMFCPDWEKNLIFNSHFGELNPRISKYKPTLADCRFHYDPTGDTVVEGGCFRPGEGLFASLVPVDAPNGKFDLVIAPITMTDFGSSRGEYGTLVQGWFDPKMPVAEFLKAYSYAGGTHHGVIVYDLKAEDLVSFADFMGFNAVVL